jgi:hypothetical protein
MASTSIRPISAWYVSCKSLRAFVPPLWWSPLVTWPRSVSRRIQWISYTSPTASLPCWAFSTFSSSCLSLFLLPWAMRSLPLGGGRRSTPRRRRRSNALLARPDLVLDRHVCGGPHPRAVGPVADCQVPCL